MSEKHYAGPDEFAAAGKRRYHEQEIPGFGWIRMQNLTDAEITEWELDDADDAGKRSQEAIKLWKAGLIVRCLVDGAGDRRFNSTTHRQVVAGADGAKVGAVFEACREWCGIPKRDIDAMAALRAIQKKSEATAA
jgi:hypothetical protein